jgi:hypothetical protein
MISQYFNVADVPPVFKAPEDSHRAPPAQRRDIGQVAGLRCGSAARKGGLG